MKDDLDFYSDIYQKMVDIQDQNTAFMGNPETPQKVQLSSNDLKNKLQEEMIIDL